MLTRQLTYSAGLIDSDGSVMSVDEVEDELIELAIPFIIVCAVSLFTLVVWDCCLGDACCKKGGFPMTTRATCNALKYDTVLMAG